jgi:zinc/manganese transport system substrate-binding protein
VLVAILTFKRAGGPVVAALLAMLAACGDDDAGAGDRPTIVVTTNILGDVVEELVGNEAEVVTIMPTGVSPHEFQASARQADEMRTADALVVNGGGFEEGLQDVVDGAVDDGVPVFAALDAVDTLELADADHDSGEDPHFFTDPARMAFAATAIVQFLEDELPGLDLGASSYVDALEALDTEADSVLAAVAPGDRKLVTNHEVFGYLADRYDFEVIGTVIPSGSTADGASAGALAELVDAVEASGVPAVFADTSSPDDLAQTLADEVGAVEVVELFSESLGEPGSGGETYLEMVRTNAERIAGALG